MRKLLALCAAVSAVACTDAQPCPGELDVCGGTCVDTRSDVLHCGACGHVCGTGEACRGGVCGAELATTCESRAGGAYVTFLACTDEVIKIWAEDSAFISQAEALRDGTSTSPSVPTLTVVDGPDCDHEWTWHVDPAALSFAAAQGTSCVSCPSDVERDKARLLSIAGGLCPSDAAVLAVERRP